MYLATIKKWHRPWWQPKWMHKILSKWIPATAIAELKLTQLYQLKLWFGISIICIFIKESATFDSLIINQWQLWFSLTPKTVTILNTWLPWIIPISWIVILTIHIGYNWVRHFRLHTKWNWIDVISESIIDPSINSTVIISSLLVILGLWTATITSPLIGVILGANLSWISIEYLFINTQWQYYWLKSININNGYQKSML